MIVVVWLGLPAGEAGSWVVARLICYFLGKNMPIIRNGEVLYPAPQWVKELVWMYFGAWNCIAEDEKTAELLANLVTSSRFKGRFETPYTGPEQLLHIARKRANAFYDGRFHVRAEDIFINDEGLVVVYLLFKGMYQGQALPKEALGQVVSLHWRAYYALLWENRRWKLDGLYSVRDKHEMLTQLGVPDWQGEANGEF